MALDKTTVSINLGNGVDQKTDSKVGPDNKFNYMQNWIYDKLGKLYKRFGTDKLPNTVVTTFPNPLSIGTSTIPSSTFSYENQLLCQNKGALYSYYENQTDWYFKGHYYPLEVDVQTTVSSEAQYSDATSQYVAGLRILSFTSSNPATLTSAKKYSVIEQSTGNYLIDEGTLPTGVSYRVLSFGTTAFFIYQNANTISSISINLTTGAIGSPVAIVTDAKTPSISLIQDYPFNFVVTNKPSVGQRAMMAYYTTGNQVKVVAIKNDGTLDSAITPYTNAQTLGKGFGIQYNSPSDTLFITYQTTAFVVRYEALTFTSSSITQVTAATVDTTTAGILSFDLINSPINTSQVVFLFDEATTNAYLINGAYATGSEPIIHRAIISNPGGVVSASINYIKGFRLAAYGVTDTLRNTCYAFLQNTLGNNVTFFMIDLFKGKTENAPYVQAKWLFGQAGGLNDRICQSSMIDNSIYLALPQIVDKYGSPTTDTSLAPQLYNKIGVNETFINLAPTKASTNSFLSSTVHTSGGYLGSYDGSTFCETSFFLMPELIDYGIYNAFTGNRMTISILQQGSASLPEITSITLPNGSASASGPLYYWKFFTTATQVNVYYVIDGVGTSPAQPGANIGVAISKTDTSYQVVAKVIAALTAAVPSATFVRAAANKFTITNTSNGVVTDASEVTLSVIPPTGLEIGSYQYKAIWTYYDVHGQAVLSGTSPATNVNITNANDVVSLNTYAPLLTNRDVSTIQIQWFRTKKNATEFFKITSITQDVAWTLGQWNYYFVDNKPDAAINTSPELLYTTGGVLDNYQIPAVKHVSLFKNRVVVSGVDDPTALYYSKTALPGAPVEFAAELLVLTDNDSDPITGHRQLDDKLIIFKERKIYYLGGDGANDLGQNSSFGQPLLIATDVGCLDHNTIQVSPLGLLFKSDKGIYLLNRSLSLSYIGKEVEEYNQNITSKALLIEDQNQIRFNLQDTNISLVYDYLFNRWTIFTQYGGTDATIWKGKYSRIDFSGRSYVENKTSWKDVSSTVESYQPTFETHWLQIKNVQDYQRIYKIAFLGDLRSAHNLNYKIYYDYDETQYDSYTFSSSNITGTQLGDSVYEPIVHLRQQKCDAIKVVIEVEPLGGTEECLQLVDMSFIVGVKRGLMKVRARKML